MKLAFSLISFLLLWCSAISAWTDITLSPAVEGWQVVDINLAYDTGQNWIWLPEAEIWIYVPNTSTRIREWGPLEDVERTDNNLGGLMSLHSGGPTTAAFWYETNGLWANQYQHGSGWGVPIHVSITRIETVSTSINDLGEIGSIWTLNNRFAYSRFYAPESGWGPIVNFLDYADETFVARSGYLDRIHLDGQGRAIFVWERGGGGGFGSPRAIFASHFNPLSGWSTPVEIGLPGEYTTGSASRIVGNETGQAAFLWASNKTSPETQLLANYYDPALGWSDPEVLFSLINSRVLGAMHSDGRVLAVGFGQLTTSSTGIFQSRQFIPGSGWSEIVDNPFSDTASGIALNDIEALPNGNFMAIWLQKDPTGFDRLFADEFLQEGSWISAEAVEIGSVPSSAGVPLVDLAVHTTGEAIAAWISGRTIYYIEYDPVNGWGSIENLFLGGEFDALYAPIAFVKVDYDSNGNVIIAINTRIDGINNVRSVRYE